MYLIYSELKKIPSAQYLIPLLHRYQTWCWYRLRSKWPLLILRRKVEVKLLNILWTLCMIDIELVIYINPTEWVIVIDFYIQRSEVKPSAHKIFCSILWESFTGKTLISIHYPKYFTIIIDILIFMLSLFNIVTWRGAYMFLLLQCFLLAYSSWSFKVHSPTYLQNWNLCLKLFLSLITTAVLYIFSSVSTAIAKVKMMMYWR